MTGSFNIIDVVDWNGIPHIGSNTNLNEVKIQCPYCQDRRGKAVVKIEKNGRKANVFHCWACNKSGNMTTLHYDIRGCFSSYKEAYWDLKEKLDNSQAYKSTYIDRMQNQKVTVAKRASLESIDRTYRQLLAFICLKKKDKEDLLRRSLTDEEIKKGLFKSTPSDSFGICKRLIKAGCNLEGVPGFFKHTTGEWKLNVYPDEGYFCPVFQSGLIVGMQIRLSNPKTSCKYIWLSSSDKEMGTSSGSPASFYGDKDAPIVIVTEGILKSYITYCLWPEVAVIGVPGVSAIGNVKKILMQHQHKTMVEVYDMDKRESFICRQDYKEQTCKECQEQGGCYLCEGQCQKKRNKVIMINQSIENLKKISKECHIAYKSYYWDKTANGIWLGNYKGIDDYLAAVKRGHMKVEK